MLRVLNFVFILPALRSEDFPVSSHLLPENRINKHCVKN